MKKKLLLFTLLLVSTVFFTACDKKIIPEKETANSKADQTQLGDIEGAIDNFEDINFNRRKLSTIISSRIIEEDVIDDGEPYWAAQPKHIKFTFNGNEDPGYLDFNQAQFLIFQADRYKEILDEIEMQSNYVTDLKNLLVTKPQNPQTIPVLPILNAAQIIRTNIAYLDFEGGSGVRFITYYAQDASPITNNGTFYTFQGLSDDGRYYFSFFYPIYTKILPDNYESAPKTDYENYNVYTEEITKKMNALPADDFTPDLSTLDEFIESIEVD